MKFSDFFSGPDGDTSSKRLFLFGLMAVVLFYVLYNLFTGKTLSPTIEEFVFYTVWGMYFGIAAERWKKTGTPPSNPS